MLRRVPDAVQFDSRRKDSRRKDRLAGCGNVEAVDRFVARLADRENCSWCVSSSWS